VAAALFLFLRRGRSPGFQVFCWVLLAVLGSAPYAATNTLLGFQSQFYFLAGFSLLAIGALTSSRPGSLVWIAGVIGGCAALVSMASGYAAAVAVIGVLLCSTLRSAKEFRHEIGRHWMSALAACAIIAAGLWLRHSPPGHESLAAKSIGDFGGFLIACLSWPAKPMILVGLLSWTPFALFLPNYLRGRTSDDPAERFILGTGFWALLQAAALSMLPGQLRRRPGIPLHGHPRLRTSRERGVRGLASEKRRQSSPYRDAPRGRLVRGERDRPLFCELRRVGLPLEARHGNPPRRDSGFPRDRGPALSG